MNELANVLRFIVRHPLSRGKKLANLVRFARWQIGARLVPGPVAVEIVDGAKLLVRPGMTGATGNVYVGLHEFEDMAFVLHFLRPGDLFVDVGANVGSYSILAAAASGANCLAFEPGPDAFDWLCGNIGLNGVSARIEARREALGRQAGQVAFTVGHDTVNHVVLAQNPSKKTQIVPVTTLDQALGSRCPAMIKIDVEGFETEVVAGARATLNRLEVCCVIMELAGAGARYGFDEAELRQLMQHYGFEEYSYAPFQRRLRPRVPSSANTLFVRNLPFVQQRVEEAAPISVLGTKV